MSYGQALGKELAKSSGGKFSHAEVNYSQGKPNAHCSLCEYYHGVDDCELVLAPIRPAMWCKKFERA